MKHRQLNGEGSIFKRSDGRWCAQIKPAGSIKPKYFYGTQYKIVKKKLDYYKKFVLNYKYDTNEQKITVDEFISNWLKTVKFNKLKPSSYDRLERTINNQIIPKIGYYDFAKLTSQQIQTELINSLQLACSYSTIKKAYDALNDCYTYAVKTHKIQFNPMNAVELPSITKFPTREIYWFSDNEIARFKAECISRYSTGRYKHFLGYGMIFVLETGLRLGEAIAVKWSDIDITHRQLHVNHNAVVIKNRNSQTKKHKLINQDFLKSKSSKRIVQLNDTAIDALQHIKSNYYSGINGFVLCTHTGQQCTTQNFSRQFKFIIKNAKIKNCGVHTLRHTFASVLFKKKVDIKIISKLLGHSNISITYNTYIHLIEQQKADAINSIDEI